MSSRNLEWTSGDEVNLDIPGLNAQWPATIVRSGAEHLHLRLREEPRHITPVPAGSKVRLHRITEEGLVAASTTLTQTYGGTGPHVMVRRPKEPELLQRRDMFRMPTALPLTVQVRQASREDWVSRRLYHHLTSDASGSGCSIETELPLEPGDRIRVTL
ncbi:MAG: PilZ domain-containing protein, partial [Myxococcota bacterium]